MDTVEPTSVYIENGILIGRYNIEHVEIDIARNMLEKDWKLLIGKHYAGLSDVRSIISFSKEAREYLHLADRMTIWFAEAILTKAYIKSLWGIYLYLAKHPSHLKFLLKR